VTTKAEAPTARWCDGLLDWASGALAAWTLVFHLARLVGTSRDATLAVWLGVLLVAALALWRFRLSGSKDWSPPATGVSA
ncbi:uncharacterized protein METZ01_LOCUS452451, partial [marine metagenome]